MIQTLSLFAGMEGFALGLESTGRFKVTHAVEIEEFPRSVIEKRYPDVTVARDVREFDGKPLRGQVKCICGGFPCQDASGAGKGAGIKGERTGLWAEYARLIEEIQPDLVIAENVANLLNKGFEQVIDDLTRLGYSVEWDCLPAAAFGAWHLRDRVWIVAHRGGQPSVFGEPMGLFPRAAADAGKDYLKWPRAGFTTTGGEVLELEPLAPVAKVKSGATRLWPTPNASVANHGESPETWLARRERVKARVGNGNGMGMPLSIAVQLWPTPTAQDAKNNGGASQFERNSLPLNAAVKLLPTPKASPSGPDFARAAREGSGGDDLATHIAREQLPTPTANRRSGLQSHGKNVVRGGLSPNWVEWLMGFPVGWSDLNCEEPVWHSWETEPDIPRTAEGVEKRMARLKCCGNALVPPAAAWVGQRAAVGLEAEVAA